ncbi:hypothetical protein F2Q68_00002059 [Brassica cretica]|uniref:glucan endo-1,3-beta-D-glucosidase n=1 Tax=Brassica cretica TaxID=69181 RepID=A0A8S9JL88_BRACR|nr:hypothetical protein F2Q68_00002059 [Brassica cretica]
MRSSGLLLLNFLLFSPILTGFEAKGAFVGTYGINYGRIADNIPSPDKVVLLLKQAKIRNVRIYDADHTVLQAFSGTGLDLVVGLPNGFLKEMSSNADHALTWNVFPTEVGTADGQLQDDTSESFAFALVNGALGVFEVYGRRIRDFRPKWPEASFNTFDGLITAMAYRVPHVVTGDKLGNIRWWDVTSGNSSSFNTCKEGIKKIKFSPIYHDSISRGRIFVLFFDNTFSFYDIDSPDPLAISLIRPQIPGSLILELDWLALGNSRFDSLVLCVVGTDGSFRHVEVHVNEKMITQKSHTKPPKEKYRPVPLCTPMLLPVSHALAFRMILQLGVNPSWFNTSSQCIGKRSHSIPERTSSSKDLRSSMIDFPPIGDPAVIEILLKVLEPYRLEGCLLDDEKAKLYSRLVNKGYAARFAFTAAIFGETSEAFFWLKLPCAMNYEANKIKSKISTKHFEEATMLNKITSKGPSVSGFEKIGSLVSHLVA